LFPTDTTTSCEVLSRMLVIVGQANVTNRKHDLMRGP